MFERHELNWRGVVGSGRKMAANVVERVWTFPAGGDVAIIRMVTDVPSYLAAADTVFCMGGYNTTCEVLGLAVPAAIVPPTRPRPQPAHLGPPLRHPVPVGRLHPVHLFPPRRSRAPVPGPP